MCFCTLIFCELVDFLGLQPARDADSVAEKNLSYFCRKANLYAQVDYEEETYFILLTLQSDSETIL